MARILCCGQPMEAETIGQRPGVVVSFCGECNSVVLPGDAIAEVIDYPRSSSDRANLR